MELVDPLGVSVTDAAGSAGADPAHTASLRLSYDPSRVVETDFTLRYVSRLTAEQVPAYLAGDLRGEYAFRPGLSAEVALQNLFAGRHREFVESYLSTIPTPVEPSVSLALRFAR